MSLPRITVITPSFDQARWLGATIRSVLDQGWPALEYMVVDGGSSDGSVALIERHADRLAWWTSGPDGGQADALNKGLSRATGDLIGFVNSDDLLEPGSLAALAEAHRADPGALLGGGCVNFDEAGHERLFRNAGWSVTGLVDRWRGGGRFYQPGCFFPRRLLERVGPFDASLRYVFDLEWQLRALDAGAPARLLQRPLARFRVHSLQKTSRDSARMCEELARVAERWLDRFEPRERRRVRASYALELAWARFLEGDRAGGLGALATVARERPGLLLGPRGARSIAYGLAPRGLAWRVEAWRMRRHLLGAWWPA